MLFTPDGGSLLRNRTDFPEKTLLYIMDKQREDTYENA